MKKYHKFVGLGWIVGSVFLLLNISACKLLMENVTAESAFASKQYTVAAGLLQTEFNKEEDVVKKAAIAEKIGDAYRFSNTMDKAETWYALAKDHSQNPEILYKYGLALKANGNYQQAYEIFKEYALNNPIDRPRAKIQMISCNDAQTWLQNPQNVELVPVSSLNSSASDYSATPWGQKQIVITSARKEATGEAMYGWTGEKHTDLFVAQVNENGTFATPMPFDANINTPYNEGTATFSANGKEIYFTHCGEADQQDDFCHIYYARQNADGNWETPQILQLFETDTINAGQAFLTNDGNYLYFAADAPDSFGDKDLYLAQKQNDGTWSYPRNLGPEINTEAYEGFPFIDLDGNLYFASAGHAGMGGLDIYKASFEGKKFTNVENLQAPLNSEADDFAYIQLPYITPNLLEKNAEAMGYFSSSRNGGKGNDDIYQFVWYPPDTTKVEVPDTTLVVENPNDSVPLLAKIPYLQIQVLYKKYQNPDDAKSVYLGNVPLEGAAVSVLGLSLESNINKRLVSNAQGLVLLEVEANNEYRIFAESPGFFNQSIITKTAAADTTKVSVVLEPIFKQQEIVIPNIYYDLDKSDIRADARPILDNLAQILRDNPNVIVEFGSHTDSRGTDAYNMKLSQARAQAVVDYLAKKNIDTRRMQARGYGETKLINECANNVPCTEEQHQENRRTTFKVIGDNFK
ncbi:MAG: OmpA family protein [Chitinophagales bacterium]|nr:OmpA family protein [Bacteroidota bacterium]MCB9043014.1 OmpA family protein [Chitinophagales bacterium]